ILRETLGQRRIRLNDDQRRRLAERGKALGRRLLAGVASLCTPDTILRWHRLLIARKWDYSQRRHKKLGRPPISPEVRQLARISHQPGHGGDRPLCDKDLQLATTRQNARRLAAATAWCAAA